MSGSIIPFYKRPDKVIVKAKDCVMVDAAGKQYIDFEAGDWAAVLGHSNDRVNQVIKSQVDTLTHDGLKFRNRESEDLSVELLEILGMVGGKSAFLNSGSEAVNLGITLAKFLTGRDKILKIDQTFLSAFGHGQISAANKNLLNIPMDDIEAIAQFDFKQIAAFVFEPGNTWGLVKYPTAEFVEAVAAETRKNGGLLMANEVTTGFGRTGKWFGSQYYPIKPDIISTGKGLGNGYPISAISITESVAAMFDQNSFRYAQSHQNDALGCAVGLEVIRTIKELELIEESFEKGKYFRDSLLELQALHGDKIKEVRARGLMIGLEYHAAVDVERIYDRLLDSGFIVGMRDKTLRFMPPLTIRRSDIDRLVDVIGSLL
jgi:acetylornithine/N-succinyldiaminopimelate aminotransferase